MNQVKSLQLILFWMSVVAIWGCAADKNSAVPDTALTDTQRDTEQSSSDDASAIKGDDSDKSDSDDTPISDTSSDMATDTTAEVANSDEDSLSFDDSSVVAFDDSESESGAIPDSSSEAFWDTATTWVDSDADTATVADSENAQCANDPGYCCSPGCPCNSELHLQCVPAIRDGAGERTGKCFEKVAIPVAAGNCWSDADCINGEFCENALVLPCDWSGDMIDIPGRCVPASAGECSASDETPQCGDGYYCHGTTVETEGICLREPDDNHCWNDSNCAAGVPCLNPLICGPNDCCLSEPGICESFFH
ncbi:MAG: hypothetical protein JXX14_25170 [Deltaproteobacteria bacterium]|nr:hypothetical protein [Deltaproteobacteria bacterium]